MKQIQYKNFSWKTHQKNWKLKKPNVCQFELTFGCGLHCKHCYTDCYNKPAYLKKELNTKEVKIILDNARQAGVIWLCFTGGDPLARKDFLDIYSYAKDKGFITTIFTNAYSMTQLISGYLKKKPPFVIEVTLNAATKETYEKISQVKGSFERVMEVIGLIRKAKLQLKIKTQITKDNFKEIPKIKKLIEDWGLKFRPSYELQARLNSDLTPCNLRIAPDEVLSLDGKKSESDDSDDRFSVCRNRPLPKTAHHKPKTAKGGPNANLFRCAVGGGDGIQVDPYGNIFACNLIRKPAFNLLQVDIGYATSKLLPMVRDRKFTTNSRCNNCNLRENCRWCPGRAYVEKDNLEAPIGYYCELAQLMTNQKSSRKL